jgi:site-specific DNA recombinase
MKQVAIYMRVSTENQEDEETIENQYIEILKRIEEDGNILMSDCDYRDNGWTGTILKRPALDQLRAEAKNTKNFDIVYVFDKGRIAREYWMQEVVINELQDLGIQTISLYDLNPTTASEQVMAGMQGLFHQYERVKIAERMRIGKMRKVKDNKKLLGYNPKFGYDYLPRIKGGVNERDGQFVINEKQAEIVRLIFSFYAEGKTKYWIREELHRLNITPPKGKSESWSLGTLDRLPTDTTYMGTHYYNKTESIEPTNPQKITEYRRVKKGSRKARPADEWLPISVPAIVETELFNKVQKQLARNKRLNKRNNKKNNYLLQGIIECECGYSRTGEGFDGSLYYRCSERVNKVKAARKCFLHGVNATVLDDLVWRNVSQLLTQPELVYEQAKKWKDGLSPLEVRLETLQGRLNELDESESRFAKMYGGGFMTESIYKDNVHDINESRRKILAEQSAVKDELMNKPVVPLEKLVSGVVKLVQDLDFLSKQEIIRRTVTKVVATKEEVTVWGHIPVYVEKEISLNAKHSNTSNSNQSESDSNLGGIGLNAKHRHCWSAKRRKIDAF